MLNDREITQSRLLKETALAPRSHSQSRISLQQLRFVRASASTRTCIDGYQAPIKWEPVDVTPQLKGGKTVIPDKAIDSVKTNYVALKGPLAVYLSHVHTQSPSSHVNRRL